MADPSFGFRVGIALQRGLPYLNDGGPQSEFFISPASCGALRCRHCFASYCYFISIFVHVVVWLVDTEELASGKDAEGKAWLADTPLSEIGPLQAAARLGEVDACRCMVEDLGLDINATGQTGTALASAAMDGRLAVAKYLLDHGADPNKKCDAGSVPLHCAAKKGMMK